ncbi:MAG TPA: hypothetical protein VFW43_01600, partial [Polaromonas sp.]|nr:hypothetical protein [Polaromonas sp.]
HLQCFRWAEFFAFCSEAHDYYQRKWSCQPLFVKIIRYCSKKTPERAARAYPFDFKSQPPYNETSQKLLAKSALNPTGESINSYQKHSK